MPFPAQVHRALLEQNENGSALGPAMLYQCPNQKGLYLNQQLQVPVIEEMHLAVPALCHLQRHQQSTVRTGGSQLILQPMMLAMASCASDERGWPGTKKAPSMQQLQPKLGLLPRTWSPPWMGSYWTVCVCVHISTAAQTAWLRIGSDCLSLHSASHLSIASNPSSSQEKTSEIAHYYALLISALWNTTHFHRAFTLFKLCFNPGLLAVQAEGWQHSSGARDDGGNQDLDISPPQNILWTWQHWFLSNSVLNSEQKAAHRGSRRYCEQHTLSCMGTRTGAMQQHTQRLKNE